MSTAHGSRMLAQGRSPGQAPPPHLHCCFRPLVSLSTVSQAGDDTHVTALDYSLDPEQATPIRQRDTLEGVVNRVADAGARALPMGASAAAPRWLRPRSSTADRPGSVLISSGEWGRGNSGARGAAACRVSGVVLGVGVAAAQWRPPRRLSEST